jgi:cysteinyl-tRNA synthetase
MHGAFLIVAGGKKMAKSEGNFLTLENTFIKRRIDPLAYRYAVFQTHYRKPMEYSEESLQAGRNGLQHLRNQVRRISEDGSVAVGNVNAECRDPFLRAVNDDLNMPRAMAAVQATLKSTLSNSDKYATLLDFDKVLGLDLDVLDRGDALPPEVQQLVTERKKARQAKDWEASDRLRDEIQALGYIVQDGKDGMKVIKAT